SALFPYTTLFRSHEAATAEDGEAHQGDDPPDRYRRLGLGDVPSNSQTDGRRDANEERERDQHRERDEAERQKRPAPAQRPDQDRVGEGDAPLPDRLPGRDHANGKPRPCAEPGADEREERCEERTAAKSAGDEEDGIELPELPRCGRRDHAERRDRRADENHPSYVQPVRRKAHDDPAKGDTHEPRGIDEGNLPPSPAELVLERGEE